MLDKTRRGPQRAGTAELNAPIVSENLSQMAFERLERAIITGELQPGEKIREAIIARRFGISRGPLREAVGRLEGLRLVTRIAHQGPRVTSLSKRELFDLLVVREALECVACRYAALNATAGELQQLKRLLDRHAKDPAITSGQGYFQIEGDQDFHFLIAKASKNDQLFALLCGQLYSILKLYRTRLGTAPGRPRNALAEHRAILAALAARDGDAAETRMREHLQHSRAQLAFATSADS